jgi:hypothetical protein
MRDVEISEDERFYAQESGIFNKQVALSTYILYSYVFIFYQERTAYWTLG